MEVDLAGGAVGGGAFRAMSGVFERCLKVGGDGEGEGEGEGKGRRLELETLRLRLHSTSRAETDDVALNALGLVKCASLLFHYNLWDSDIFTYVTYLVRRRSYGLVRIPHITSLSPYVLFSFAPIHRYMIF